MLNFFVDCVYNIAYDGSLALHVSDVRLYPCNFDAFLTRKWF